MPACSEEEVAPQHSVILIAGLLAVVLGFIASHPKEHLLLSTVAVNALAGFTRQRGYYYYYIGQPVAVLIISVFLINKHGYAGNVFGGLYVATLLVLTAAVSPCTDSYWIYVPDGAAILYLIGGVASHYKALYPSWCLFEAGVLAVVLGRATLSEIVLRAEHLTWWSLVLYGVWNAAIFCEYYARANSALYTNNHLVKLLTPTVFILNLTVVIGVFFMSATSCDLLADALHEAGAVGYIAGNFLMHYYPLLRTIFSPSSFSLISMGRGAAIAVLYSICYPATEVYGCSQPAPEFVPLIIAAVTVTLVLAVQGWHILTQLGAQRSWLT